MRSTNRSDRSDPVTPADNPKSGNACSTGTCPRRCNLDLDTNRILAWTAIASRIASRHARPGPLRGARRTCRRWGSRLRVGASVRRNDDNGQGDKFHEGFHGDSPISAWLRRHETSTICTKAIAPGTLRSVDFPLPVRPSQPNDQNYGEISCATSVGCHALWPMVSHCRLLAALSSQCPHFESLSFGI